MGTEEADGIAIRALGSLFKLTEVFLWDDFHTSNFEPSNRSFFEVSISDIDGGEECSTSFPVDDDFSVTEDLQLAQEMDALGLPISFRTNKEKRNARPKGKSKKVKGKSMLTKNMGWFEPKTHGIDDLVSAFSSQCCPYVNKDIHRMDGTFNADDNSQCKACILHENEMDLERTNTERPICEENGEVTTVEKVNGLIIEHECLDIAETFAHPYNSNGSATVEVSEDPSFVESFSCLHDRLAEDENSLNQSRFDNIRDSESEFVDSGTPGCCFSEYSVLGEYPAVDHTNEIVIDGSQGADESPNWIVVWDTLYRRNYFYNVVTEESTWYPPRGFEEYLSFSQLSDVIEHKGDTDTQIELSEGADECRLQVTDSLILREKNGNSAMESSQPLNQIITNLREVDKDVVSNYMISEIQYPCNMEHVSDLNFDVVNSLSDRHMTQNMSCDTSGCKNNDDRFTTCLNGIDPVQREVLPREMLHIEHHQNSCNNFAFSDKKNKVKRIRSRQKIISDENNVLLKTNPEVAKYWCQRYSLFSKFDYGIKMDTEGWYSVTPEQIAKHHATRCGNGIFIDCFTGVGGNAIQFAMRSKHVVAIDIDPVKIDYARHNATIYGVLDHIDFILGDFFHLELNGDIVFLSPPWGGPDYGKVQTYDIQTMLLPQNAYVLFKTACKIAPCVVMFLPRNVNLNQLAELALTTSPPWKLEVEKNFLNGRLKAVTAYFHETSRCRN